MTEMLHQGHATAEGTAAFSARAGLSVDAFSEIDGVQLSSIGLSTYPGESTDKVVSEALHHGINVFDTARNDRGGRSERVVGQALRCAMGAGVVAREQLFVSSKAGFVAIDEKWGNDHGPLLAGLRRKYVDPGIFEWSDLADGSHCLRPSFIEHELEVSRRALGLQTIDLYYVQNPETQLRSVTRDTALKRIRDAFVVLEKCCAEGTLRYYGVATCTAQLSLVELLTLADEAGGRDHHFRAVQLQSVMGEQVSALAAAKQLGLYVFTSRSVPGVGTVLFGTTRRSRAREGAEEAT